MNNKYIIKKSKYDNSITFYIKPYTEYINQYKNNDWKVCYRKINYNNFGFVIRKYTHTKYGK